MAFASVTYTSASGTTFALTNSNGNAIEYLRQSDISVTVNNTLQTLTTDYTFNAAGTSIVLNSAVSGATVVLARTTSITDATVSFTAGSTLTAQDLNNSDRQNRFALQEFSDVYDSLRTGTGDLGDLGGFIDAGETWVSDAAHAATTDAIDARVDGKIDTALTGDVAAGNAITITDNSPASGQITIAVTDGAIDTAELANNAVTTAKITDSNVTTAKINDAAVTTAKIADAAVTTAKLANDSVTSAKIADGTIIAGDIANNAVTTAKILDANVTTAKIADSNVTTAKINDAAVTEAKIAGSAVTSGKIASGSIDSTKLTGATVVTNAEHSGSTPNDTSFFTTSASDARYFRQDSSETIDSGATWSGSDSFIATTAAIDARIIDLVDDVGGFVPIANETSFPATNPDINNPDGTGTIISVAEIATSRTPSSGTVTIANGSGSNTVTINGCGTTVLAAGFGVLVETTSTLHTYTFHRLVPKATEVTTVASISGNITTVANNVADITTVANDLNEPTSEIETVANSITNVDAVGGSIANVNSVANNLGTVNDFAARYRVASSDPTTSLDTGDLVFNTTSNELRVYNGSAWQGGVTATGNLLSKSGDTMTGALGVVAGTAGAPSVFISGDTNTGLYSPGADQVAVATNGVERLSISSAGEVTTANQKLNLLTVGRGAGALFTNVALGDGVLAGNTTGLYNTAIGTSVLSNNTTGNNNSAIGISALLSNTIGINNAAAGADALRSNSAGNNNSALGGSALYNNTTGSNNTCVGHQAGLLLTTGSNNTIIGNILGTAGLADTVIIGAGATERLRIDSSGRVGIGTSSPGNYHPSYDNLVVGSTSTDSGVTIFSSTTGTGGLIFADGTSANDRIRSSITYSHANDLLNFSVNSGQSALVIDSSQRVGIGTTAPSGRLDVETASDTYVNFSTTNNGSAAGICLIGNNNNEFFGYANNLRFATVTGKNAAGFNERMRITSAGNVGIGTTSPAYKCDIDVTGSALRLNSTTTGAKLVIRSDDAANATIEFGDESDDDRGAITYDNPNNALIFQANAAERARIDSSGRLLVGTSSTSAGTTAVFQGNSNAALGQALIYLQRGEAATSITDTEPIGTISFADSGSNRFAWISCFADANAGTGDYPGRLTFATTADGASSPTERMRITSDGLFKFSNTGAYGSIDAGAHGFRQGTAGNWALEVVHAATSGNAFGIHSQFPSYSPNNTSSWFYLGSDSTANRFIVYSNGGIANYQGNNVNLSDEREKKNIEELGSTWDCLKHWELKKFHYNADEDTVAKRYGVIAQQVEEHCPEVISEWVKQQAEPAKLDDDGNELEPAKEEIVRMGVKEQQMYWMAIKALQEAQVRIEQLEQRLSDAGIA
jgi:hypothetical protein